MDLTLISIKRNTPDEGEHLLTFGYGGYSIISAKDEEQEIKSFKKLKNHLLRGYKSDDYTDQALEAQARKEIEEASPKPILEA